MLRILSITLLLAASTGCASLIGVNMKHKSPHSATKYPSFNEKDSLRGALNKFRSNYDVSHYDLSVDFNLKKHSIKGKVKVIFSATEDLDKIQMDLHKNLSIDKIERNGQLLMTERKYNALFITFDQIIKEGESAEFTIEYSGKPIKAKKPPWEGGFVWKKSKGKPWVGVACEQLGAHVWWPVKDHLSDEPDSMDLRFTVPKGLYCVANGELISEEKKEDKTTFHWKVHNPINSYNVTFYIGDYVKIEQDYEGIDGMHKLTYYVKPEDKARASKHFHQVHDMIRFFEETYGVYPWWEDGYKLVSSPYEGMEHQSAIAYGDGYEKNKMFTDYDYIILHETAHEWWGNSITVSDFADVWIQEGFATYSEALYVEHADGIDAYRRYLALYGIFVLNKAPVVGPKEVNYWDYKDGDPYMKGAMTLHSLRTTLDNDSLFFSILKGFYQKNAKQIVTSEDFVNYAQEVSGQDLTWFFDQFLHSRFAPKLSYYLDVNDDGNRILRYKWSDVVNDFKMPIYIQEKGKWTKITPTTSAQVYVFPKSEEALIIDKRACYFTTEEAKF